MKRVFRQIFEKFPNIKFHECPFSGIRVFHTEGQTDTHDEADRRVLQFSERA
jgi:hypothetical protein